MKKLMFAMAAIAAGAAVADVTSANTVGYMTGAMASDTAKNKYNMMSVPFEAVDGKGISLSDINFANHTVSLSPADSDNVMFWKPDIQDYEKYYFFGYAGWEDEIPPIWQNANDDSPFDTDHPEGIAPGTVFWYYSFKTESAVSQSMTVSGAVAAEPYQTFTVNHKVGKNAYYFIANPYPANIDISWNGGEVVWGSAVPSLSPADSDNILIWDASKQDYVKYYLFGYAGWEEEIAPIWQNSNDDTPFEEEFKNGLPAGTGFWYYAYQTETAQTQTIRFNSPLAK